MPFQRPICASPAAALRRSPCSSSRRKRERAAVWNFCSARSASGEPMKRCAGALSPMTIGLCPSL
eukprot:9091734-Lingulodinium_polyedra.AAC.1